MELLEESKTIEGIAESLAAGLSQEQTCIRALQKTIEEQIAALHDQKRELIEDMTLQTSQEVRTLEQLRSERFQHMLHLSEFLGEGAEVGDLNEALTLLEQRLENADLIDRLKKLHAELPAAVETTREKSRQLAYSLQYALHLGHAIIEAVQGAGSPPPIQVYTAAGETRLPTSRRMMVNQVG